MDGSKLTRLSTGREKVRGNEDHLGCKKQLPDKEPDMNKTWETTASLVTCGMSCFPHSSCDCQGPGSWPSLWQVSYYVSDSSPHENVRPVKGFASFPGQDSPVRTTIHLSLPVSSADKKVNEVILDRQATQCHHQNARLAAYETQIPTSSQATKPTHAPPLAQFALGGPNESSSAQVPPHQLCQGRAAALC